MTKAEPVGIRMAALNALRDDLHSAEAIVLLRRSLADPMNRVVQRAAELVGDAAEQSLVDELLVAYTRLLSDALKTDPGCLGKTAIARALVKLDHNDAEFYRAGIAYEQHEPVWGDSPVDSAAELRGICAAGLIDCASSLEVLNRCAVLLADPCADARAGAARALAGLGQPEGAPLLRLKLLSGDKSADVVGECCSALLRLDRDGGVATVVELLASVNTDVCLRAALALGESRLPGTFAPLQAAWSRHADPFARKSLLVCIGLVRSAEASEFLLSLIDRRDLRTATEALAALSAYGKHGELRQRIAAAVAATGNARLASVFEKEWDTDDR